MAKRRNEEELEEVIVGEVNQQTQNDDWFNANKNLVMGLLAGLLLIVGGYLIYKYMLQEPKEKEAKAAIYKAEQQFARDSFALALENPGGGFYGLLDIVENYGGTKTGNLAKLYAGISYLNLGRYEDAISYLKSHSPAGAYSPILKNGNMGDAYSELGDFDQALSFYEKAANTGDDALLTPYYLYKYGLLAKKQGNNSQAATAFQKIKDKYPNSNEGVHIEVLLRSVSNS